MDFEKLSKKCPWLHWPYSYNPKVCRAAQQRYYNDRGKGLVDGEDESHSGEEAFHSWGEVYCEEKNCAIWYWLKVERKRNRG